MIQSSKFVKLVIAVLFFLPLTLFISSCTNDNVLPEKEGYTESKKISAAEIISQVNAFIERHDTYSHAVSFREEQLFSEDEVIWNVETTMNYLYPDFSEKAKEMNVQHDTIIIPKTDGLISESDMFIFYDEVLQKASQHYYGLEETGKQPKLYDLEIIESNSQEVKVKTSSFVGLGVLEIEPFGEEDYWYAIGDKCNGEEPTGSTAYKEVGYAIKDALVPDEPSDYFFLMTPVQDLDYFPAGFHFYCDNIIFDSEGYDYCENFDNPLADLTNPCLSPASMNSKYGEVLDATLSQPSMQGDRVLVDIESKNDNCFCSDPPEVLCFGWYFRLTTAQIVFTFPDNDDDEGGTQTPEKRIPIELPVL